MSSCQRWLSCHTEGNLPKIVAFRKKGPAIESFTYAPDMSSCQRWLNSRTEGILLKVAAIRKKVPLKWATQLWHTGHRLQYNWKPCWTRSGSLCTTFNKEDTCKSAWRQSVPFPDSPTSPSHSTYAPCENVVAYAQSYPQVYTAVLTVLKPKLVQTKKAPTNNNIINSSKTYSSKR